MLKFLTTILLGAAMFTYLLAKASITDVPILGYFGVILCLVLSGLGSARGISSIGKYVSGASLKAPRVATRSILGTVICEANFLLGVIHSTMLGLSLAKVSDKPVGHYILFSSGLTVGICNYYSSVSTGLVCAVISVMDAKDPRLFFKIIILEIIPASVGVLGFVLGMIIEEKANIANK